MPIHNKPTVQFTRYAKLSLVLGLMLMGSAEANTTIKTASIVEHTDTQYYSSTFDVEALNGLLENVFDVVNDLVLPSDRKSVFLTPKREEVLRIRLRLSNEVTQYDLNRIYVLDTILQFTEVVTDMAASDPLNSYFIVADFIAYLVLDDFTAYDGFVLGLVPFEELDDQAKRLVAHFDLYEDQYTQVDNVSIDSPLVQYFDVKLMRKYAVTELRKYKQSGLIL